jgi:hypothetical protein
MPECRSAAFLLTVPFSQGFTRLDEFSASSLLLLSTAVSTALLTLLAYHRLLFRMRDKNLVLISNRLTIAARRPFPLLIGAILRSATSCSRARRR